MTLSWLTRFQYLCVVQCLEADSSNWTQFSSPTPSDILPSHWALPEACWRGSFFSSKLLRIHWSTSWWQIFPSIFWLLFASERFVLLLMFRLGFPPWPFVPLIAQTFPYACLPSSLWVRFLLSHSCLAILAYDWLLEIQCPASSSQLLRWAVTLFLTHCASESDWLQLAAWLNHDLFPSSRAAFRVLTACFDFRLLNHVAPQSGEWSCRGSTLS